MPTNGTPRAPWVSHSELLDHLTLLNAFHHLRTLRPEPEFLHMALFRFELWIGRLEPFAPIDSLERLPPLDVLMVWHAYCLASRWYFEDSRRMYPILQIVDFPLALAAAQYRRSRLKSRTLGVDIPDKAIADWLDKTNTIHDPVEYFEKPSFRTALCPSCEASIETRFTTRAKGGWAESSECRLNCDECGWKGRKSDLAFYKLIRDLQSISSLPQSQLAKFDSLAGTLSTSKNLEDVVNAVQFNRLVSRLIHSSSNSGPSQENPSSLDPRAALQIIKVLTTLPRISKSEGVSRMLSAYSVAEPFSLDLITYMKRQESFRKIVIDLGWGKAASPGAREDVESASRKNFSGFAINRAASRYQAFVDLVRDATADQSIDTCIPTYDIDLAWRTHQLKGVRYSHDMFGYLGKSIDHFTDRIFDTHTLAVLFESTSKTWEKRYNVIYSQYPPPDLMFEKPNPLLKSMLQDLPSRTTPLPKKAEEKKKKNEPGVERVLKSLSIEPGQVVRFVIEESSPVAIDESRVSISEAEQEQCSKVGLRGVTSIKEDLEADEEKSGRINMLGLTSESAPRVTDVFIPQEDECWGEQLMKDLISVVDPSLGRSNHPADLIISETQTPDAANVKPELGKRIRFEDEKTLGQDDDGLDPSVQQVSFLLEHQLQRVTDLSPTEAPLIPTITKSRPNTASTEHSDISCAASSTPTEDSPRPTIEIAQVRSSRTISIVARSSATLTNVGEIGDTIPQTDSTLTHFVAPSAQTNHHDSRATHLSGSTAVGSDQSDFLESSRTKGLGLPSSASGSRSEQDTDDSEGALVERVVFVPRSQARHVRIGEVGSTELERPLHSARRLLDAYQPPPPNEPKAHLAHKSSLPSISQLFRTSSTTASQLKPKTGSLKERQPGTCESLGRIRAKQQDCDSLGIGLMPIPRRMVRKKNQSGFSATMSSLDESHPRPRTTQAVTPESRSRTVVLDQRPGTATSALTTPLRSPTFRVPQSASNTPPHVERDEAGDASSETAHSCASEPRQARSFYPSRLPKLSLRPKARQSHGRSDSAVLRHLSLAGIRSKPTPAGNSKLPMALSPKNKSPRPSNGILKRELDTPVHSVSGLGKTFTPPARSSLRRERSEPIKSAKISWGEDVGVAGRGLRKRKDSGNGLSNVKDIAQEPEMTSIDEQLKGQSEKTKKNENEGVIKVETEIAEMQLQIESGELTPTAKRDEGCGTDETVGAENLKESVPVTIGAGEVRSSDHESGVCSGSETSAVESLTEYEFSQLVMDIPIGRIGFVEGSEIRLLEAEHLIET